MTFLLDTSVVSEPRRPRPNGAVLKWLAQAPVGELFLSPLVIGEIHQGVTRLRRRGDERQAELLADWLDGLERLYADRILPVTVDVANVWGELNVPDRLPIVDSLLAATAKVHGLTLVTRNTRDVARTGVPTLNPFEFEG